MPKLSVRLSGIAAITIMALTGCSASSSTPAPSSTTKTSSVASQTSASPSSSMSSSVTVTPLDTEAEAIRVYRAFFAEEQKLFAQGGADQLPEEIKRYLGTNMIHLEQALMQKFKNSGLRLAEGQTATLIGPKPITKASNEYNASIVLHSCSDERNVTIYAGNETRKGALRHNVTYFQQIDGQMKIIGNTQSEVQTCPLS